MRPRPPAVAALATALSLCLLVVAACSGGSGKKFIPPPPGTVAAITTAPLGSDLTGISLAPVEGRIPAEEVEVTGGDAVMSGLIAGPDGPVAGATVRLERFVGDAMGRLDVISNADGTWRAPQIAAPPTIPTLAPAPTFPGQLPTIPPPTVTTAPPPTTRPSVGPQGILGGRYRVRAWKGPDLALTTPQILFVEAKQNRSLTLQLSRYTGTTVSSLSSPDPPVLDGLVSVTAVVTSASVDGDGVVRSVALPNAAVALSVGPGWLFVGGPAFTNGSGRATFQLRCVAPGPSPIELTVNGAQSFSLPVRACAPAPTTSSSSPDPGGSSSSSSIPSSSTTRASTPTT